MGDFMLQELQPAIELLKVDNRTKPYGNLTCISSDEGIRCNSEGLFLFNDNFLYAVKVYKDTIPETLYVEIESNGSVKQVLNESEGTMPELFLAPNKSIWSVNTCTNGKKDMEIILPFNNRQDIKKEYKYRPFVGDWIGNVSNQVIFQKKDYFSSKPDQLCILDFMDNVIKKRKIVKIPTPNRNQIYLDNQEELQLIAWKDGKLLHRSANIAGEIINERILGIEDIDSVKALIISFKDITVLIGSYKNILMKITIHVDGNLYSEKLLELEPNHIFYNLWEPQIVDSNKFIIRFNGENFNGWAVLTLDKILECFVCFDRSSCYKDILSNTIIELPNSDENNYAIYSICTNKKGIYQVAIYNSKKSVRDVNNLYIFSL